MTTNQITALSDRAPQFFLRTPQGRKGVTIPENLEGDTLQAFLIERTAEEAEAHGYAILDRVETHPVLQIMRPSALPVEKGPKVEPEVKARKAAQKKAPAKSH